MPLLNSQPLPELVKRFEVYPLIFCALCIWDWTAAWRFYERICKEKKVVMPNFGYTGRLSIPVLKITEQLVEKRGFTKDWMYNSGHGKKYIPRNGSNESSWRRISLQQSDPVSRRQAGASGFAASKLLRRANQDIANKVHTATTIGTSVGGLFFVPLLGVSAGLSLGGFARDTVSAHKTTRHVENLRAIVSGLGSGNSPLNCNCGQCTLRLQKIIDAKVKKRYVKAASSTSALIGTVAPGINFIGAAGGAVGQAATGLAKFDTVARVADKSVKASQIISGSALVGKTGFTKWEQHKQKEHMEAAGEGLSYDLADQIWCAARGEIRSDGIDDFFIDADQPHAALSMT